MEDELKDAIDDLAGEIRDLSDRIAVLEQAIRSGQQTSGASPDYSLSGKLDLLTQEVRRIRKEMF